MVSLSNTGTSSRTRRLKSNPRAAGPCSATRFRDTADPGARGPERRRVRASLPGARIAAGSSRPVVGTHALIQESVAVRRLGPAGNDEQRRSGVEQRASLVEKGDAPDVLLLTATPSPRSLAHSRYGDLDVTQLRDR